MTNEIDWTKAPEWATSYAKLKNKDWYYYLNDKCYAFYTNLDEVYEYGLTDESTGYFLFGDFDVLEERPKPLQPVFTQKMADAGDDVQAGMKCLVKMIGAYLPVTITYNSEHVIAFTYETDNGVVETCKKKELNNIDIKPITPPIELIDGERYHFVHDQYGGSLGIYNSEDEKFYNWDMWVVAAHCTNIKLLEVK